MGRGKIALEQKGAGIRGEYRSVGMPVNVVTAS